MANQQEKGLKSDDKLKTSDYVKLVGGRRHVDAVVVGLLHIEPLPTSVATQ